MDFSTFRNAVNKQKAFSFEGIIVALDPGETTGAACFSTTKDQAEMVYSDQLKTWPLEDGIVALTKAFGMLKPDLVVFESYQVYEWKTEDHTWSQIPTVQVIGMIKTLCIINNIPFKTQTAQIAKGFCNDEKLKEWGYWLQGLRHARDAIRHATYFLLFGPSKNP
jgi:hypothetical protein